ncbi:hypothetical protein QVD17_32100 [Tagetes erecta]|uniref:Uncharacterized protein n=1 Tax=Tagetes erecta TaxID=13708 RepID=A0AAD8NPU8_TARER|nr:hypothetical protein QVD17_32100 [Tagetes erecta]
MNPPPLAPITTIAGHHESISYCYRFTDFGYLDNYPNPYPKFRVSDFRIPEISDADSDSRIHYPNFRISEIRISEFSDTRL